MRVVRPLKSGILVNQTKQDKEDKKKREKQLLFSFFLSRFGEMEREEEMIAFIRPPSPKGNGERVPSKSPSVYFEEDFCSLLHGEFASFREERPKTGTTENESVRRDTHQAGLLRLLFF